MPEVAQIPNPGRRGENTADATEVSRSARETATELRSRLLHRGFKVPMLPETAARLLSLATNPDTSLRDLQREIAQDPTIAARVVSAANSSLFAGRGNEIQSLRQAAAQLGTEGLRDLVSQAIAEAYVFRGRRRGSLKRQRIHGVAVAHIAREAARLLQVSLEGVFLCGLFHDLGHSILLQMTDDGQLPELERCTDEKIRDEVLELLHPLMGDRVAREWGLPPVVSEIARSHHFYRGVNDSGVDTGALVVVAIADRIAYHAGLGDRRLNCDPVEDPAWEELGIGTTDVQDLLDFATNLPISV